MYTQVKLVISHHTVYTQINTFYATIKDFNLKTQILHISGLSAFVSFQAQAYFTERFYYDGDHYFITAFKLGCAHFQLTHAVSEPITFVSVLFALNWVHYALDANYKQNGADKNTSYTNAH